jgi:predicted dehydrogenase
LKTSDTNLIITAATMTKPFRIAVVGAGLIGESAHVPAVLACPDATLSALVDPDAARCRRIADKFQASPKICIDIGEALGDIDAAIIATPNHTHHAIAMTCLRAGVNCLIEKPLAASLAEGEAIAAASEEHRVTAAVGYSSRFIDGVELLGELIAEGFFGEIRRFAYQFGSRGGWSPVSSYILDRKSVGGGVTVVVGTHFMDWLLHWFGYPDEIAFADDSLGGPEANSHATFGFTNRRTPLVGTMRLSKTVPLPPGFVMETERGIVSLEDKSKDAEILLRPRDGADCEMIVRRPMAIGATAEQRSPNIFVRQLVDFITACRTNTSPRVSARQGCESLRLIEAMYAARTPLPEFSSGPFESRPAPRGAVV